MIQSIARSLFLHVKTNKWKLNINLEYPKVKALDSWMAYQLSFDKGQPETKMKLEPLSHPTINHGYL